MKLETSCDYKPATRDIVAIIQRSDCAWALPDDLQNVSFAFDSEVPNDVPKVGVVLIHPSQSQLPTSVNYYLKDQETRVEVWFWREDPKTIDAFLSVNEELAIHGIHVSDNWLHLLIGPVSPSSRELDELKLGLMIPKPKQVQNGQNDTVLTEQVSWRSLLITQIVPFAKPFKKYLPTKVVVSMYRILEKLR